ncbi:hypothetical protein DDE18_21160 [Nocardioides gansuensis]|uniref:Helix-turn-helix domain-containing protein n=2 Tax=Nocardioides gansuensis TaxID=2138300 RepID=A0A2T8F4X1_9ACTN|nr:hypothetical protein DDE18_21160 [Nocardioides gansuensis]
MSWREAADLIGCTRHAIAQLIEQGHLHQRQVNRAASLSRASVEAATHHYATQLDKAAQARASREQEHLERTTPPDDGEVWLDVTTAALVLGVTPNAVRQRINNERLPATRRGRRWWLRRVDVERASAAAAFHARADTSD